MIYLDNNATTPVRPEVFEEMKPYLTTEYGNPSSKYYPLAINAKNAVEEARERVAKLIGAKPEEIIFTSGATESSNMIIKGIADYKKYYENKGNHIITSKVEHKATLNTCRFLNGEIYSNVDATFSFFKNNEKVDRGYKVTFLDVNKFGQVELNDLENSISDNTTLVSIIWGNNEIGTLNDVNSIGILCKKFNVNFHTDATQVLGKIKIDVSKLDIDFMSMSAHKLYGPKGIGAAYIKGDDYGLPPITSLIHGGEQENGLRGSTLSVHNIVGFGKAAELAFVEQEDRIKKYKELDKYIINELSKISDIRLLGDINNKLSGVYSIIVDKNNFNNERFIKKISDRFAISTGSACTAGQPSHVLEAIGLGKYTSNVIRLSISSEIEKKSIDLFLKELQDI